MTILTQIPQFYCMFTLNCFLLNKDFLPKVKDQDSNEVEYFPLCKSYPASSPLTSNVNSFSMICDNGFENDQRKASNFKQINSGKLSLNTVVLKGIKLQTIENFANMNYDFETLVLEECFDGFNSDLEIQIQNSLKGLSFKNFVAFDNSIIFPELFMNSEQIYIDDCALNTIYDKNKILESSFKTSNYENLRHLTIKNIRYNDLIIQGPFFPDSPLVYVDLSHNNIKDFEDFYHLDREPTIHDKLIELYLNDNKLSFIPENLFVLFPKLKIFHIHNNPIFVLSSSTIEQLYKIQECFLFDLNKADNRAIYVTKENEAVLKDIEKRPDSPDGFFDSFLVRAKYRCVDKDIMYSELKNCNVFENSNPIKVIKVGNVLKKESENFEIFGPIIDLSHVISDYLNKDLVGNSNEINFLMIEIDEKYQNMDDLNQFYEYLRIYMNTALLNGRYLILSNVLTSDINPYLKVIMQNPSFLGIQTTFIHDFEEIKLRELESLNSIQTCIFNNVEDYKKLRLFLSRHINFVKYFESSKTSKSSNNEYMYGIAIDYDAIDLLKYLLMKRNLDICHFPDANVESLEEEFLKIDFVNVNLRTSENKDVTIEEQARKILQYQTDYKDVMFIITIQTMTESGVDWFKQQKEPFQKVNNQARHFISSYYSYRETTTTSKAPSLL